jgi:DNA-binding LacI/PurR family transcriptional regulator
LQSDTERFAGFKRAMADAKLPVKRDYVVRGDGRPGKGRARAAELLEQKKRPTAIFCYNDMTALGVLEEAAHRGFEPGQDLSVVGFDDLFFAALLQPGLTTIRQPKRELGRRAMALLLALLRGEEAERTAVIQGELVVRGSTGPVSTNLSGPERTPRQGPGSTA